MAEIAHSIDLDLSKKLQDRRYRQRFFIAETSARIAKQLIELRKRRSLNQQQVADLLETGQPAISRVENASYRNWSFNTLRRLAEAMDARIRVMIVPSEDVLREYEEASTTATDNKKSTTGDVAPAGVTARNDTAIFSWQFNHETQNRSPVFSGIGKVSIIGSGSGTHLSPINAERFQFFEFPFPSRDVLSHKDEIIAEQAREIDRLRNDLALCAARPQEDETLLSFAVLASVNTLQTHGATR